MHVVRAAVEKLLDVLGEIGTGSPVGGQVSDLLLAGDFAGKEKPEKTFGERFLAARSFGEDFLAFRDGLSTESDTLFRIKDGSFPDKCPDASSTAIDLIKGDLTQDLGAIVFLQLLDLLNLSRELGSKDFFEGLVEEMSAGQRTPRRKGCSPWCLRNELNCMRPFGQRVSRRRQKNEAVCFQLEVKRPS